MKFKELVLKNRSCRGYDESFVISRELLLELVDCARLSPSARNAQPLKYFLSCTPEMNAKIQPLTGWAAALPGKQLPYEGHRPTAFIVVCCDKNIADPTYFMKDVGIASQTILLAAAEQDISGCMIGSFSPDKVKETLSLAENIQPALIIALGKSVEKAVIVEMKDGNCRYYRDENDVHYVPKRPLAEEILN